MLSTAAATLLLLSLTVYVLTGGADFGAGFWELVFRRHRYRRQSGMISTALAPIWEANHVWLIFCVVLLAAAFPRVLALLCVSLSTPMLLMLIGITLRGAAFAFRRYGPEDERFQARWGLVFSTSSAVTPVFLGMVMGAAVSGSIRADSGSRASGADVGLWLSSFPIAVGLFTFTICVFLSAIYLAAEATDPDFVETFRRLGIGSAITLAIVALTVLLVAKQTTPAVYADLTSHMWSWPLHIGTAMLSVGVFVLLVRRHLHWARAVAVLQVLAIMIGLGLAQFPFLIAPDLTIFNAAAPDSSLRIFLLVGIIGLAIIAPAFGYLYWIFQFQKRGPETFQQSSPRTSKND